jgi:putative heme-binding domain-containing protein
MALALTFGDPQAFEALHKVAADHSADARARSAALQALVNAKDPQLLALLNGLLADPALRGPALRGLAAANDEATPQLILKQYRQLTPAEKQDAIQTLASRPAFALALLDAVAAGNIAKSDLSAATVRQIAGIENAQVRQKLEKVWGIVRPPAKDKAALIAKYKTQFTPAVLKQADVAHGRVVFTNTCAQCHTLFDAGGKVGPNLTGSQRANLDYLLENVVDPSAAVAREYQMTIVDTTDGRTINGVVVAENDKGVTIRTTNEDVIIPKDEIAKRRVSPFSMMPEGLLDGLKPEDARDLIGYLSLQQPPGK